MHVVELGQTQVKEDVGSRHSGLLWAVILRQWRGLDPRFLRNSWALSYMAVRMETVGQDMTIFSGFSVLGIQ